MSQNHLLELAQDVIRRAAAAGAPMPNAPSRKAKSFPANVRMRELENLKEAGSRGAGLRILRDATPDPPTPPTFPPRASNNW